MIENLTTEQRRQLEDILLNSFSLASLRLMLSRELGRQLENEVNAQQGLRFIISDLVDVTLQGDWTDKLLIAAQRANPYKQALKVIARDLNVIDATAEPVVASSSVFIKDVSHDNNLQNIVNRRSPLVNFNNFNQRLTKFGVQVCRIEITEGNPRGTGWLVGPNLLLTAYHVIEDVDKGKATPQDIRCRFDYTIEAADISESVCGVDDAWLIDKSPYTPTDEGKPGPDPTAEQLDYALIRLNKPVGNELLPDGTTRGWIKVSGSPTAVSARDLMLIVQHPQGRSLELGFGEVLSQSPYNSTGTRIRYDTNTEKGSSGAPCLTINLLPFGLHHASGPANNLPSNQCVPLRQIIQLMKLRNVTPFWT